MRKNLSLAIGFACLFFLSLLLPERSNSGTIDKTSPILYRHYPSPLVKSAKTPSDTFLLADYTFDGPLDVCIDEGWVSVDRTAQWDTLFHVDDFQPLEGLQSLWCGVRPDSTSPVLCGYATLPGYGNGWSQYWESDTFVTTGQAVLSFIAYYDCEPGYDYGGAEYYDPSSNEWIQLVTLTGQGQGRFTAVIPQLTGSGTVKVRLFFKSDGAWSDEDGLYDGTGLIVDSLMIWDQTHVVDFHNFEAEPIGAKRTLDSDWWATAAPGFGDFACLMPGVTVPQCDPCTIDLSCLWTFFCGSPDYTIACNGDSIPAIPFGRNGLYLANEIWSPWIEWSRDASGSPVPADADKAIFDFQIYRDNSLDQFIFYYYAVRSLVDGCPTHWRSSNDFYYGGNREWTNHRFDIYSLVDPNATHIQVSFGVVDFCAYWCGIYGWPSSHPYTPLFDRAKIYRVLEYSPVWTVENIDLFQDNFPADGTVTGNVRCDAGRDTEPLGSPSIVPQDYVAMNVSDADGLGTGPDGRAAVYVYVKAFPILGPPDSWEAPEPGKWHPKRWPLLGGPTAGGFYKFQCDTLYDSSGSPVPDRFCFDLNDDFFTPPTKISFYFAATNTLGETTYWSRQAGTTLVQAEVEAMPMEMQCLPAGRSDILYVDVTDGIDGDICQSYFDIAFRNLGIDPDRYDKRGIGAGLGSRAASSQIVDVYRKIIWSTGHLSLGIIGDGTGNPEKSPDAQLLTAFLDLSSTWNPGLYLTGNDLAREMTRLGINLIDYVLLSDDHVSYGLPVSPLVVGLGFMDDTLLVDGSCPLRNRFDVLEPSGPSVMEMYYYPDPQAGAVISEELMNSQTMTRRVILEGFSFQYIRDDVRRVPYDAVDHLMHILEWFENPVYYTGAQETPLVNSLAQNYPNPFNPQTTIRFSLVEKGHVALRIFNVAGQLVRTLKDEVMSPGVYGVVWDGRDEKGDPVASGVYLYGLEVNDFAKTRKMVLLK